MRGKPFPNVRKTTYWPLDVFILNFHLYISFILGLLRHVSSSFFERIIQILIKLLRPGKKDKVKNNLTKSFRHKWNTLLETKNGVNFLTFWRLSVKYVCRDRSVLYTPTRLRTRIFPGHEPNYETTLVGLRDLLEFVYRGVKVKHVIHQEDHIPVTFHFV